MSAIQLHIDPFYSNRNLDAKLFALKIVSNVRSFLRSRLVGLKNWIIQTTNKDLAKVFIMVKGLNDIIEEFTPQQAKIELPLASKALRKFRKHYTILEKIEFFNNEETKFLSENTLLSLYHIEGKLRSLSLSEESSPSDDKDLQEIATRISINSFHQLHAAATI